MREINFLPGPVSVYRESWAAFTSPPISHRSEKFYKLIRDTETRLCRLVGARHCVFFMGSATLANEAVAAQLSLRPGRGLVVSNGEFGERLVEQAERFRLNYDTLRFKWGAQFDLPEIKTKLRGKKWIWFVHCETSTGVLNPLELLSRECARKGVKVCLDAVSSIGCIPVDLSGIYLASGASGKGLGSLPGVAFVIYNHHLRPSAKIPKYLDIGYYGRKQLVPFTFSSNLMLALRAGVMKSVRGGRSPEVRAMRQLLESFILKHDLKLVGGGMNRAPHIFTIALKGGVESVKWGRFLEKRKIRVHYNNAYLLKRNWLQIVLMGDLGLADVVELVDALEHFLRHSAKSKAGRG